MGIDVVDRLGAEVERRWRAADYDPRQFSDVATTALAAAELPTALGPDDVVDWALAVPALPRQENLPATFGQPPVTLFRARRFYIEALFWIDGSTSIHQHAFSGAFQVLAGASIETRYAFEPGRMVDGHLVLGALRVSSTALLRQGDVRPIASGLGQLIHSLFHLERPSVTIVVRTFRDAGSGPQFNFLRPGVGHDPFFKEETLDRSLELVRLLRQIEHPAFEEKVGELVERLDLHGAYRVLLDCAALPDRSLADRLLERLRDRSVVDVFRAAFEESRRLGFLISRRTLVKDPELRFFLGVLLNAHRRQDVLTLMRARFPEAEPARQVASLVRRLSNTNLKLQAAGVPWQPNILGLPEMTDELERALADALADRATPADDAAAPFLQALSAVPSLAGLFG
jgi:hypothetical protein